MSFFQIGWRTRAPVIVLSDTHSRLIAVLLMVYPYVVSKAWLVYAIGALLCYGLYLFRK